MATRLIREALRTLYKAGGDDPHPGLLLQRGLAEHDGDDQESKTRHIARVCGCPASDLYRRAYERWKQATDDPSRFRSVSLQLQTRLFIGLAGGGMLETGCAIGHSHGAPYIPGSSIKGVVSAHVREVFGTNGRDIRDELFGSSAPELSGLVTFHDAWWVPGSAESPLTQEIVTTHHRDYYGKDGSTAATDFDKPIPNALVAVRGGFLFVIEGPVDWLDLTEQMLISALSTRGIGAKTRAGYGLFAPQPIVPVAPRCQWVDDEVARLRQRHHAPEADILRGRHLAEAWSQLEDPAEKRAAFQDIRTRWQEEGWWDNVPAGRSTQRAKAIYDAYPGEE